MKAASTHWIAILVAAVAISFGASVMGLLLPELEREAEAVESDSAAIEARLYARILDVRLEAWSLALADAARHPTLLGACLRDRDETGRAATVHLLQSIRLLGRSADLVLLDCFGREIAAAGARKKIDFEHKPWVVRMLDGQRRRHAEFLTSSGESELLLATPVLSLDRPEGILIARMPLHCLEETERQFAGPHRQVALLRDRAVLREIGAASGGRPVEIALEEADAHLRVTRDPRPRQIAMEQAAWRVALAIIVVAGIVILAGTVFGNAMIARPLRHLTSAARSLALGRRDAMGFAASSQLKEVHELSASLKTMAETIHHRERELEGALSHLEDRVRERTKDLERETESHRNTFAELRTARDRAEAASRAKGSFLANMSHEIRTPMNGIMGMVAELAESRLDELQAEAVRVIGNSAENLLTIIDDILDFSKIEAGKLAVERIRFDLDAVVSELMLLLRSRATAHGLSFAAVIAQDVPREVHGDPMRLRQVLLNLLGNALKFTTAGRVTLRIERVDARLGFAVEDTGIGIEPAALSRLFAPFEQADGSTTRVFGGTGLGLSISRRLVELMGGRIDVQSTVGRGSRFSFDLALEAAAAEGQPTTAIGPARILALEPDPVHREALVAAAKAGGHRLDAFDDLTDLCAAARTEDATRLVLFHAGTAPIADFLGQAVCALRDRSERALLVLAPHNEALPAVPSQIEGHAVVLFRQPLVRGALEDLLARAASKPPTEKPSARTAELGLSVLVAEDNAVNRRVIQRQLERLTCRCQLVENGRQALQELMDRDGAYDLVLMDCHMPTMDGYEAARRWREHEGQERRIPIIALTADAISGARERCLAAGMDDFLTKPVRAPELMAMLERWTVPLSGDR